MAKFHSAAENCHISEFLSNVLCMFRITLHYSAYSPLGLFSDRLHQALRFLMLFTEPTIFARNYGTAAVISYNLKGIAPPVPPVQCWIDKT